jgi:hypothetical protein
MSLLDDFKNNIKYWSFKEEELTALAGELALEKATELSQERKRNEM